MSSISIAFHITGPTWLWLSLWPLAGFVFWAIYQAKFFPRYPFGTLAILLGCLVLGPLSWVALLIAI